jgi:4-amino-4-deoxy-L-arabinose transferase-like glycosyltransferase
MGEARSSTAEKSAGGYLLTAVFFAAALLFRIAFLGSRSVLVGDETHYAESLHRFLNGQFLAGFSDFWSFFYPLSAFPFGFFSGDAEAGLRLLSVFSGAAVVIPCVYLARRLWSRSAVVFAGLFVVLHPSLIEFSTAALTQSLYSLLLVLSLLLFIGFMQSGGRWRLVLLGIVLGLAYLTRQEAQFFMALAFLGLILGKGGPALRGSFGARLFRAAAVAAFFVVVISPYFLLLHQKTGRWTGGSKASVNLSSSLIWEKGPARERYVYGLNDEGTERRIEEIGRESVTSVLWRQKKVIASKYVLEFSRGFANMPKLLSSPFLFFLIPLGLFGRKWKEQNRGAELVMLLVGISPFALYALFEIEIQYLVPFLPVYLLWAARGCGVFFDWFKTNVTAHRVASAVVMVLIFASLLAYTGRRHVAVARTQTLIYKEIGTWIRENEAGPVRVLAHSACPIGYYAGNPRAGFIPWADIEGLLRYARHHDFTLLVVDEAYFREYRPFLAGLLDDPPAGLEEVKRFARPTGETIVLYRLIP